MFGWWKKQLIRSAKEDDEDRKALEHFRGLELTLAELNRGRDAQETAAKIVKMFAEVVGRVCRSGVTIFDARKLPFTKTLIREALLMRIRFYEQCCKEEPNNPSWKQDLDWHYVGLVRLSDFREIDPEDEIAVRECNEGRLDWRKSALLCSKYIERRMKEDGKVIPEPLERDGERLSFDELCRRKGIP